MNDLFLAHFCNMLKTLAARFPGEKLECAFMGYPDVVIADAGYESLLGGATWRTGLVNRENADKLARVHFGPMASQVSIVPTIPSLIAKVKEVYGIDNEIAMTVFDFQSYEGGETLHDFNEKIRAEFANRYHLLWNGGTLEHIFDIATALNNVTFITRERGLMFHAGPINMLNHGFYNLNPVLFENYFHANGCRLVTFGAAAMRQPYEMQELPPTKRFSFLPPREFMFVGMVEKEKHLDDFVKPIQGRYADKENWR